MKVENGKQYTLKMVERSKSQSIISQQIRPVKCGRRNSVMKLKNEINKGE